MSNTALDLSHAYYSEMIRGLHANWNPHAGQIPVGEAIFLNGFDSIFVQCGRKFGKTEFALYVLWRIAKTFPNSPCYFIAPFQKQAKEIVWSDPRVKYFGPREWLLPGSKGINDTELRLRFKNGSFIKIDGSDNYEAYRGVKYKVCVFEEFKDHRPEFRKGMNPNASVLQGLNLYIGSPPDHECDYTVLAEEHKTSPGKFFYHAPTWLNPHISRKWLKDERTSLYKRGEGEVWEREYAAKYLKGGSSTIFPMLSRSMVKSHDEVIREIHRDRNKLKFYLWHDPAGASCFATLFVAINPYTKKIYCLDEIYETDQKEMTVERIGKRAIEKRQEIYDRDDSWTMGYDEAATWFNNEWMDNFPDEAGLQPTHKIAAKKNTGLSLIKDILLSGLLVMSDRCKKLYWEMDQYRKDKNGNIPKKDDHLIDDFRYILAADGYSLKTQQEILREKDPDYRGSRIQDDFPNLFNDFKSENWEEYNG